MALDKVIMAVPHMALTVLQMALTVLHTLIEHRSRFEGQTSMRFVTLKFKIQ